MANTFTSEMTENQAQKFEKMLDDTLEILNRMKKESPERDALFDKMYEGKPGKNLRKSKN